MRILLINASPRRQGNLSKMLDAMRVEIESAGVEAIEVKTADLCVKPCTGCMVCRRSLQCVLPDDDAQRVLELMKWCDAVVVGAPCYWGNIPGELKVLFDRMVYGMMGESPRGIPVPLHKGKKAILVSICTTPFPFNIVFRQTRGVVNALREILKWSGFRIVKSIERGGTKLRPVQEKDLERRRKAVRKLLK